EASIMGLLASPASLCILLLFCMPLGVVPSRLLRTVQSAWRATSYCGGRCTLPVLCRLCASLVDFKCAYICVCTLAFGGLPFSLPPNGEASGAGLGQRRVDFRAGLPAVHHLSCLRTGDARPRISARRPHQV